MREIFWYKRALALTTDGWVELWCNWIGQTFCVQISKDIASLIESASQLVIFNGKSK